MYAKYTRIFRTPKETSKSHQNSDFLERIIFKHPNGCFFIKAILIPCEVYVIPSEAWESPGTDTLLNKAVPFREIATAPQSGTSQ